MPDYKRTALFQVHKQQGARIIPFCGWEMPVEYSGVSREHTAVRTAAGLFDVSHMGEFEIQGPHALDLVQFITVNDASQLVEGQVQYSAMAYPDGTVVDDLLVYRLAPDRFMFVVNAANTAKDLDWVLSHNRFNASVQDITDRIALLAVQGPKAIDILQPLTTLSLEGVRYYHFVQGKIADRDAILSRTGYTGEDGFEIYLSTEHSEFIWSALLKAGSSLGLLPAGLGARNTLRLEAKMLLYGNDMDNTTTLLEAGLGWIVKFTKDDFVGREALLRQKQEGVARKLVGFEMLGREIGREHYPVYVNGRESGYVTSGSPSITLGKNIGLAYLPVEHTIPGTKIQVAVRGRMCDAQVVPTPFYKRREHA